MTGDDGLGELNKALAIVSGLAENALLPPVGKEGHKQAGLIRVGQPSVRVIAHVIPFVSDVLDFVSRAARVLACGGRGVASAGGLGSFDNNIIQFTRL